MIRTTIKGAYPAPRLERAEQVEEGIAIDPVELGQSMAQVLGPALPALSGVAGSIVHGAAEKLGSDAWDRAKQLWRALVKRNALHAAPEVARAAAAGTEPDVRILAAELTALLRDDSELAAIVEKILHSPTPRAHGGVNITGPYAHWGDNISGDVTKNYGR